MTAIPTFYAESSFVIKRLGTVYTGPCPYDWYDRRDFKPGLPIIMDGVVRKIKAYEAYATYHGPRLGQNVGLLLEPLE